MFDLCDGRGHGEVLAWGSLKVKEASTTICGHSDLWKPVSEERYFQLNMIIPVASHDAFCRLGSATNWSTNAPNLTSLGLNKPLLHEEKIYVIKSEANLLHHTSGLGVSPASQAFKEGSNTRVQYSLERSIC